MDYFFLILSLGLLTFAIGPVTSSNKGCLKLSKCSAELGAAAKENQLDELCRAIKKAMDCFDAAKDGCQNEKFRKSFNSTFEKSKALYAKRCGQKDDSGFPFPYRPSWLPPMALARYSFLQDNHQQCELRFQACLTPEVMHASEHENQTRLCKLAPAVLSCMERVIEEDCMHVTVSDRAKLFSFIDRLRQRVNPNCRDAATRSTAISAICLLVCLALGQLGLRHTSG